MTLFGGRLKTERMRLGFKQNDFADKVGVTVQSQIRYESDKSSPDADYLEKVLALGGDVIFLLTGERSKPSGLNEDEEKLLISYRYLTTDDSRKVLLRVASAMQISDMVGSKLLGTE
ncbi:MAG: helix-turn-helix transcriptional regulator [Agitococcus sp.]|nr:helix-turn-helix transcriptional regulator [Agitococcus sp.]